MSKKKEDRTNPKDLMGQKKVSISLVPPAGIRGIAEAMYYGAHLSKRVDGGTGYGEYNWRDKEVKYSIYLDAIMRHTLELVDRNDIDKDSLLHHLKHIGANATILLDAIENKCLIDNRPYKKDAGELQTTTTKNRNLFEELKQGIHEIALSDSPSLSEELYKKLDTLKLRSKESRKVLITDLQHSYKDSWSCSQNKCMCSTDGPVQLRGKDDENK